MKKIVFFTSLIIGFTNVLKAQNIEVKRAEESLINLFGQRLYSKLNTVTLAEKPFKKLFYYSYQIIEKDSVSWFSYNHQHKLMDSIAHKAFIESVDSMKKKGIFSLLTNEARTYFPVFIFYKIPYRDMYNDSISITPMEIVFGWGINEKFEPEPVYRITKPFFFTLPKSKEYYKKNAK